MSRDVNGVQLLDPSKPALPAGAWVIVGANGRHYVGRLHHGREVMVSGRSEGVVFSDVAEVGLPVALLPAYEWITQVLASTPPQGSKMPVPIPTGCAMFARPLGFFADEQTVPFQVVPETLSFVAGKNARDMVAEAVAEAERWRRAMAARNGESRLHLVDG